MSNYSADEIELINLRESVRRRPGMYVGGTGEVGRLHLVLELVGNAFDLALRGRVTRIEVRRNADGSIEVIDDGPGLDLSNPRVHSYFADGHQRPTADGHLPHVHLANWGVGAAIVNFLSAEMQIDSVFEGRRIRCEWRNGGVDGGEAVRGDDPLGRGTTVRFLPDTTIFDDVSLPVDRLTERMNELACLFPGLETVLDDRTWRYQTWQEGFRALSAQADLLASVEYVDSDGGETPVSVRLGLMGHRSEAEPPTAVVYANYRRMDDRGEFTRALESELARLETTKPPTAVQNARPTTTVVPVVSLTMLRPETPGPSRSRLDDPRAVDALQRLIAANSVELATALRK